MNLLRHSTHTIILVIYFVLLSMTPAQAQTPSIPVGLADPYLMFVPVGWRTDSQSLFGFVSLSNNDMILDVLDPTRFEQYIPYDPNTSPRQLLIDYWQFFYVQTPDRAQIDLLTIGENTVALYIDPQQPSLATYIVELANQRFALIEAHAQDGTYDNNEQPTVHSILGTLSVSLTGEIRTDVLYDTVPLPSNRYSLSMPPDWQIEASLVAGQIFLVGDGLETLMFAPDSISEFFDFPPDVNLAELAQVIESTLFEVDLSNIEITQSQAGDRRLATYGFRSLSNQTDTQVALVQLPDGSVAYFKTITPQDKITVLLRDRLRRIALSIQTIEADDPLAGFTDDIRAKIIPNSGEWRVNLRDMMRLVCDGQVERLVPLSDDLRAVFGDFDTIVADPDGESITIASDGIASLFQRGTLRRDETDYFQIIENNLGYTITPQTNNTMLGRLNIINPNDDGSNCRIGVSLQLRYVE